MMTDQQKHAIESLRKEGLSYRQIAEEVGATPACIKTYFHRKRIRDATRLCEQCHKPIITTVNRSNRRFCSTECKSRWWYQQRTGRVVQSSAKIKVPASPVSVQIIDADQNSLGDGITGYIASVAVAGVMLNNGIISKREFLSLEKQLLEKYGIPENSIYRDYRIVKVPHSSTKYFYGSTDYTANTKAQFLWEKYESGSWVTVQAEATGNNGNTYTVHAADVVGSATYRCRSRYNSGSVYNYDTITVIDKTDNYQADIDSTAGDVFKNTVGQTCLICRLWQNGAEVDPLKSTTYSTAAPSSPASGDYYYKIASNSPTTALMRYSGSAWVDVTTDATYGHEKTYTWYRRDKDGNPMDSGAAFATGKVIYVDGDDVTVKTVFVCEVE